MWTYPWTKGVCGGKEIKEFETTDFTDGTDEEIQRKIFIHRRTTTKKIQNVTTKGTKKKRQRKEGKKERKTVKRNSRNDAQKAQQRIKPNGQRS